MVFTNLILAGGKKWLEYVPVVRGKLDGLEHYSNAIGVEWFL